MFECWTPLFITSDVDMFDLRDLAGAVMIEEAMFLEAFVRATHPSTVIETGCGLSTYHLVRGISGYSDVIVRSFELDGNKISRTKDKLLADGLLDKWKVCEGNSLKEIPNELDAYPHIQFAFIDSEHTHEQIMAELGLIYERLVVGGIIIGHDDTHDSRATECHKRFATENEMSFVRLPTVRGLALLQKTK